MALLSSGQCLSQFPSGQVVVVATGYEAAAELLTAPTAAPLLDLCRLTQPHVALLELAAKLKVPVLAFGAVSARITGQALAKVQLAGEESLEDALSQLLAQPSAATVPAEAAKPAAIAEPPPPPAAAQAPEPTAHITEPAASPSAALPPPDIAPAQSIQTPASPTSAPAQAPPPAAAAPLQSASGPAKLSGDEPIEAPVAEPVEAMYAEPDEIVNEPQARQAAPAQADFVEVTGAEPADAARDEPPATFAADVAEAETLDAEQVDEPAAPHEGDGQALDEKAVQYQGESADIQFQAPPAARRPIRTPRPSDILTQEELDALLEEKP